MKEKRWRVLTFEGGYVYELQNPDAMCLVLKLTVLFLLARIGAASQGGDVGFTYNGFAGADLQLDGIAHITSNGLLMLTNSTSYQLGHVFYPTPIHFLNSSSSSSGGAADVLSFSTTFVFTIVPKVPQMGGDGMAFVISPTRGLPSDVLPRKYLGLFADRSLNNSNDHIFAVELDTVQDWEFNDIDDNHVGVDINGLVSVISRTASFYFYEDTGNHSLTLKSGASMQLWIDYDGVRKNLSVSIAPINYSKPVVPLFNMTLDLSSVMKDPMYIGFSASTGNLSSSHCVQGWSFKLNGPAEELHLTQLPTPNGQTQIFNHGSNKKLQLFQIIGLPIIAAALLLGMTFAGIQIMVMRKRKFAEVLEEWELDYGPHRFNYKDLYVATKGFKDTELLGRGGFGRVYKGVLPNSRTEVAVKKISHDSTQGMREFVAEIATVGKLRHRNLVTLLGYCRRKGELLLVYECMPNGSLDRFLFDPSVPVLNWTQRFRIIRGVASALFYLHEGWEQVVIHRDVKSSNVLLDGEFNARLGDFGLARLYGHGTEPHTTHLVGTLGYLAPELPRTCKANTSTDVFAFGACMLEVACGRRPIKQRASNHQDVAVLVDWVFYCWSRGAILDTVDPNLGIKYVEKEIELVLKLGLLCSNWVPAGRPTMRQVVQYLEGELPLPDLSSLSLSANGVTLVDAESFDEFPTTQSPSISECMLSGGR